MTITASLERRPAAVTPAPLLDVRNLVRISRSTAGSCRASSTAFRPSRTSRFPSARARCWGSSANRAPARPRSAARSCGSSSRHRARWSSTASTSRRLPAEQMRQYRRQMQIVFQDPFASLNPAHDGGRHRRPGDRHPRPRQRTRTARTGLPTCWTASACPPRTCTALSARVLGRPAPAHRHRARARGEAELPRRRRAGLRARRLDPRAGRQPAGGPEAGVRPDPALHRARSRRRRIHLGPRRRHVSRPHHGDRAGARPLHQPAPSLYAGAAVGRADPGPHGAARARHPAGRHPLPAQPAIGCVFRTRCPIATAECAGVVPPLTVRGPDHLAACIRQ